MREVLENKLRVIQSYTLLEGQGCQLEINFGKAAKIGLHYHSRIVYHLVL